MTIARGSSQSRYLNNFPAKNDVLPSVSTGCTVLARGGGVDGPSPVWCPVHVQIESKQISWMTESGNPHNTGVKEARLSPNVLQLRPLSQSA